MEERLTKLKALLGVTRPEKDELLRFALQTVEDQTLAYIHHELVPKGLENVLVLMAAAYWRQAGLGGEQGAAGPVTGVSRGDVSTTFAAPEGGAFSLGAEDGFFGWRTALNAYRRLKRETTGGV